MADPQVSQTKVKSEPKRCRWATSPLMIEYHDREWGVPVHDDRTLFEFLILEGAQAGLSWETILKKRENYRAAFDGFDAGKIEKYDRRKFRELMANIGIVRNRLKIDATISNAKAFLAVQKEFGSFDSYIWKFVGGKPKKNSWRSSQHLPASTPRIRCHEQGPEAARFPLCGFDDLLRVHAGRRDGRRPFARVLPPQTLTGHAPPAPRLRHPRGSGGNGPQMRHPSPARGLIKASK